MYISIQSQKHATILTMRLEDGRLSDNLPLIGRAKVVSGVQKTAHVAVRGPTPKYDLINATNVDGGIKLGECTFYAVVLLV